MEWFWTIVCIAILGGAGYYYYDHADKHQAGDGHELHETKGILMSKTKDHEALWIHYSYKDMVGNSHEMSEKVPYIDLWESLKIGKEIDIIYNDEGLSVLKTVGRRQAQPGQQ